MLSMLDLERFRTTPLTREPFEFLVVPEFVKLEARPAIDKDYPEVGRAGSFPLREVTYGPGFAKLIEEMRSEEFRKAFEEKFNVDLTNRPDMITVRGRCSEKDGKIHTDSETKIITILVYMNSAWESSGGQLRLLRSGRIWKMSFWKCRRPKARCWRFGAAITHGMGTSHSLVHVASFSSTGSRARRWCGGSKIGIDFPRG